MTTWITVCDTCKREGWSEETHERTHGEEMAELIESRAEGAEGAAVRVRRTSCFMNCKGGCNVAVQAEGKIAYVLGGFEPGPAAADAIVEYAGLHARSASGMVPFKERPEAVKGHFVSRVPPPPGGDA